MELEEVLVPSCAAQDPTRCNMRNAESSGQGDDDSVPFSVGP